MNIDPEIYQICNDKSGRSHEFLLRGPNLYILKCKWKIIDVRMCLKSVLIIKKKKSMCLKSVLVKNIMLSKKELNQHRMNII